MNFIEVTQKLKELLSMNEMAITIQNSGILLKEPFDINEFIDKCYINHDKIPMDIPFRIETHLTLDGINPQNPKEPFKDDNVQLLYGSRFFGIKHIIEQREGEFKNKKKVTALSSEKVKKHLTEIPEALESGKVLLDFIIDEESIRNKTYFPYSDRLIVFYNDLFYVFFIKSQDIFCTCLNTMFKPTEYYKNLILKLNNEK